MNMTIPGKVFCDLGFEKILPESTISRLAVLPAVDEIQKRQEIFRRLENDAYLDAFRKLREGLGELTSAERRFRASEGNIERMLSLAGADAGLRRVREAAQHGRWVCRQHKGIAHRRERAARGTVRTA